MSDPKVLAYVERHLKAGKLSKADILKLAQNAAPDNKEELNPYAAFHTKSYFDALPEKINWLIETLCAEEEITLFGGPAKHGKTWILLSVARALLEGVPLFGKYKVDTFPGLLLYLIPEAGARPMKKRLNYLGLSRHLYDPVTNPAGRLLIRTLSAGPILGLNSPEVMALAKDAIVFLDTAIRFIGATKTVRPT